MRRLTGVAWAQGWLRLAHPREIDQLTSAVQCPAAIYARFCSLADISQSLSNPESGHCRRVLNVCFVPKTDIIGLK
jgi:hypothetical protein